MARPKTFQGFTHFTDISLANSFSVGAQATIEGNLIPDTTDNRDLGSSGNRWNRLFVQELVFDGTVLNTQIITNADSPFTASVTNRVILCDTSSGTITINLLTASGDSGRVYTIKKTDSSANTVTVDPNGSETIDGFTTAVLSNQFQYATIISDNTNWQVIANN